MGSRKSVKSRQFTAGFSAAGGAFALGNVLGWSAPAAPRLLEENQYFPITPSEFGLVSSIVNIGCAISCLPIGYLMKKFGRKPTMLSLVIPFTIGWMLVTWAKNFTMLLTGRLLLGVAGGAFCVTVPQYASEISQKEFRGVIGSFFQLMLTSGILFVYIVGAYSTVFWMNIACSVVPLIFGAAFFFMPESPVYLVEDDNESQALKSFRCLRGMNYDAKLELSEIKAEVSEENKMTVVEAFKQRGNLKAFIIGMSLLFFMQMSGVNIVIFYATEIFKASGSTLSPDISTIIVGAILMSVSLLGSLLVERAGRRILLLISGIFMTISLSTLGTFFYFHESQKSFTANFGWLPLASLCVFNVSYALGYGPLPYMMVSEIYSKDIKPIASPITGAFSWTIGFAITLAFEPISNLIGFGQTFWVFTIVTFIGVIFVLFMIPETKGKSIAAIQEMMRTENHHFLK